MYIYIYIYVYIIYMYTVRKKITLEHSHFWIALEHKMLHHFRPQPTNKTSDLLTGAALWKAHAFQSDASTKKRCQ